MGFELEIVTTVKKHCIYWVEVDGHGLVESGGWLRFGVAGVVT